MFDDGDPSSDWPSESEGEIEEVILYIKLCPSIVSEGASQAIEGAFH